MEERRIQQPDDGLDGCALDFKDRVTRDDEIEGLLQKVVERKEEDAIRHGDGPETA